MVLPLKGGRGYLAAMKTLSFALALVAFLSIPQLTLAQNQVDYGLLEGYFLNEGGLVDDGDGRFELGLFSGYTDGAGASYFSGKDYSTLRSSFSPFATSVTAVQLNGQIFQTVDLLGTAGGTRLFAWVFSTTAASSSGNWSVLSGVVGGVSPYDAAWLAVSPGDPNFNYIELGTTNNFMYANSNPGNNLQPNSFFSIEGADVSVVPEPGTLSLLFLGAFGVAAWRVRRRWSFNRA